MRDAKTIIIELLREADIRPGGDRPQDFEVREPTFYRRVLSGGSLALGESYLDGWWEANSLDAFFFHLARAKVPERAKRREVLFAAFWNRLFNPQSRQLSKRVAALHYDLGNNFYADMLDPWMQYTCGYWRDADRLEEAQEAKLELVCRKLHLQPGDEVLELGGGWGGFAKFAAERYGCRVTSYNISTEQVKYAREFCRGLPVTICHDDYREARGEFDKVVSIGMCEHVGGRNYRSFLELKRRRLRPGGLLLLHTIGRNVSSATADPWFRKYIFPGGQLPSLKQLMAAAEGLFVLEDFHNIGADYDPTLMEWHRRFEESWPKHRERLGEHFYRMWRYYLLSCAGAFRSRNIHLWQFVFSPDGVAGGYAPVRVVETPARARSNVAV